MLLLLCVCGRHSSDPYAGFSTPRTNQFAHVMFSFSRTLCTDDPLFDDKIGSCTFKLDDMELSEAPQEAVKIVDNNIFSEVRLCACCCMDWSTYAHEISH